MIHVALIVALIFGVTQSAIAERLWLVIGASDSTAAGIARKVQSLRLGHSQGLVVQTTDCGENKNSYVWVAEAASSADAAQATLSRIRKSVKDAYVERCDVSPGTLLALRITAIDPSIADVPTTAVNWQDEDRVSVVRTVPDGSTFVIVRYFTDVIGDPLEGRRERVMLVESSQRRITLEENCTSSGSIVTFERYIAFHCVREQAGDNLLHHVLVYDRAGNKITEIQRCRDPNWSGKRAFVCNAESVRPDGKLELQSKHFVLAN